jgi:hypothetical protein
MLKQIHNSIVSVWLMVDVTHYAGRYRVAFIWTCLEQFFSMFSNMISVVKLKQSGIGRLGMDTRHIPS